MKGKLRLTRMERLFLEAARIFNATLDYEVLIEQVLLLVMTAVRCEAAQIFRIDHRRTNMKIRFMRSGDEHVRVFRRELGQDVVDWVAKYREPMIINDTDNDPRVDPEMQQLAEMEFHSLLSVPLIAKGQMIGVVEAINKTDNGFTNVELDMLVGLNNQMAVAIDNAHLFRIARREALAKDLLYQVGKKLSGSLDLDEVIREIMDSLNQVVKFDAGGVYVVDSEKSETGSIYTVGYESSIDPKLKLGQGLAGHVAKSGEPTIVPDVSLDDRYVNARTTTRSEITVPMVIGDRVIGVFNLESDQLEAFNQRSLSMLSAFASQAAISIERAQLHQEIVSSHKLEEQLNIARVIQGSFLPRVDPDIENYDIAGWNTPSERVGGDYYDFIDIVGGQTGIVIGDVSGKGIPAALIMASFRASLIAEIRNNYSIRTICRKVNNLIVESVVPGNFVSAVYGVLDSKNHILTFANCGHNLPFALTTDDEVEFLRQGGPLLGVVRDAEYEERPIFLHPGEVVVFYTDGVTEVFDKDGTEYGLDRLIELVKKHREKSSAEIQSVIHRTVTEFAAPDHTFDDLTMIVLKRLK